MNELWRPEVIVFDVVETLASLDAVRKRLERLGRPRELMDQWFTRLLRDAFALTATGDYRPFAEVAASALEAETKGSLTASEVDDAVAGFAELTPQFDAVEAVITAQEAGFRVFTLSNGSEESTRGFLARAGLSGRVEHVLSVDSVRAFKPVRAPYELAIERAGVVADRIALVAVHSWDVQGARTAGLMTGWTPRLEGRPTQAFLPADVVAETLPQVIQILAGLPDRPTS